MRRRYDDMTPHPDLLVFKGYTYATEADWVAAFGEWCDARERWCTERGIPEQSLPKTIDGDCPFDPNSI